MRKFLLLALLLWPTLALADTHCSFQAPQNLDLQLHGVHAVEFHMNGSDLHLDAAAVNNLEVRGRACASSQKLLGALRVTQHREGDRLVVTAEDTSSGGLFSLFHNRYAYLTLHVRMPDDVPVILRTGSGDAWINGVASLRSEGGSGDLKLRGIKGAVELSTGSGDVSANDIGSLDVKSSGSGDFRVHGVHGHVHVAQIGSGDLHLANVDGKVDIGSVGSGDVTLRQVTGDVGIGSIGSGDIDVDGVGGDFSVRSHGSGDIDQRNVKGKVSVPDDH